MMHIAYIATEEKPEKKKRLTGKQKLHKAAMETLARRKKVDEARAQKRFATELAELRRMENQLAQLNNQ